MEVNGTSVTVDNIPSNARKVHLIFLVLLIAICGVAPGIPILCWFKDYIGGGSFKKAFYGFVNTEEKNLEEKGAAV